MSSEESNKTSQKIPSQDSVSDAWDDLLTASGQISPDVSDMIWAAEKKKALQNIETVSE